MRVRHQFRRSPIARPDTWDCVVSPEESGSSILAAYSPMMSNDRMPRAFMLRFLNLPKAAVRYNHFSATFSNFVPYEWQIGTLFVSMGAYAKG